MELARPLRAVIDEATKTANNFFLISSINVFYDIQLSLFISQVSSSIHEPTPAQIRHYQFRPKMEKDLRDAYAALKLLRADLVKTRRDKRALEASLTHLQTHGPLPSSVQSGETQCMQQEDFNAQLWRLAAKYEARLGEMERKLAENNCQKKKTPEFEDNQREDHQEEDGDGVEKLAMLNKLHSLTATVKQQTQTMLAQQAAFALQKGELETRLEDALHALQEEKLKVADAVLEQQAAKEKYEFLKTQVEILKEEKEKVESKLAAHAQTSSILKQQLEEKEEERAELETQARDRELKVQLEYEQKMNTVVEELNVRVRENVEIKEKQLSERYQHTITGLQQKCGMLESELSSGNEKTMQYQKGAQEQYNMTLRDLESKCAELQKQLEDSETKRAVETKQYASELAGIDEQSAAEIRNLQNDLVDIKAELSAAKANKDDEAKKNELKLAGAMQTVDEQNKTRKKLTTTLHELEETLESVRSQLAATEMKLSAESIEHEKSLAEVSHSLQAMQQENDQYVQSMHGLEINLAELQNQLAASKADRLAEAKTYEGKLKEVSRTSIQHEKNARALAMEKKSLELEIHDARQTSKLNTEKIFSCQSMMEQKAQEHVQYLNQVQERCESLETQLLAAEDHKLTPAVKPIDASYTLKVFHGLSDYEIASLPSSKSWTLLRVGISEMGGFLPNLQVLLGVMDSTLKLCENHADILPTLFDRLQSKSANEKGHLLIMPVALKKCCALHGDGPMPTPTFTITSRETALILQNWTQDRSKQLGVRRWLARMEAYPGVPPLKGASSNRVLELPAEGCTLELEDMTPEVKDAFLLLLIPILKQNRALHVRVFTRYTGADATVQKSQQEVVSADASIQEDPAETVWAMRIHVQSAVMQRRPSSITRPTPLHVPSSHHGPPSPLAPTSPASSISSSTSSTNSSRLQIIQERLQYLHNNG
ncbi:unnamed protein product [Phytophthora fragariaefolia]|uniref:Unnamed protein product n=1 Tax=Phytophthora fragariaefolia TaxID=1490495 RepID=A0A9W7CVR3_9STRA|nr:unnamed protein product [Phytophthora fragariaefolia]